MIYIIITSIIAFITGLIVSPFILTKTAYNLGKESGYCSGVKHAYQLIKKRV